MVQEVHLAKSSSGMEADLRESGEDIKRRLRQSVDRTNQSLGQQIQRGGVTLLYSDASIINCGVNIFHRIVISAQHFWKKRYLDGDPGNSVLCKHQCSENR